MNKKSKFQSMLPFWQRVIFVDWHGVLSNQLFWNSILSNQSHRVHSKLKQKSEELFKANKELVKKWMRGEVDSREILELMDLQYKEPYDFNYFQRKLNRDCRDMSFDVELIRFLQNYRMEFFLVLATDNMECFYENFGQKDGLLNRFDYVLCSSELGVLKSDSIYNFFSPWLYMHKMNFENAILIDDSEETCKSFQEAGGVSIHFKNTEELKNEFLQIVCNNKIID
jgi:FMN phosphatase YigB (HAD superfamily)